jgi:hypothetical protein
MPGCHGSTARKLRGEEGLKLAREFLRAFQFLL